jgi:hypothetical protein
MKERNGLITIVFGLMICLSGIPIAYAIQSPKQSSIQISGVPEYYALVVGDLCFMDGRSDVGIPWYWLYPGPHNDHVAIYIGNGYFVDARGGGVHNETLQTLRTRMENPTFYRVITATQDQRQLAADWAKQRVGAEYQNIFILPWFALKIFNPSDSNPTANTWYCGELVWAAYYNATGIDIDYNEWTIDGIFFPTVMPQDILNDGNDIAPLYPQMFNPMVDGNDSYIYGTDELLTI